METFTYRVESDVVGSRLDRLLTQKLQDRSRTYIQELIEADCVTVNGTYANKPSLAVKLGDTIHVSIPAVVPRGALALPSQDMGVRILFEHEEFLIVYKPAGLVVHAPHAQSTEVSLVDWLVHSFKDLKTVGPEDRPGIVHRLDKDTSGILIIPRTNQAHAAFTALFQERSIEKTYLAVVKGHPKKEGLIDLALGRHPVHRHKIAVLPHGRESSTNYEVVSYLQESALLKVRPHTGRTHQIRVHCAALGHPVLGDATYGTTHTLIARHALHAYQLAFTYKDHWYSFSYDMPQDMKALIIELQTQL